MCKLVLNNGLGTDPALDILNKRLLICVIILYYRNMVQHTRGNMPNKSGFTLVEVMIAIFIFAIVITSGFACLKMGMGMVDNSRHHTRAAQIMQSEIEKIRSMPWAIFNALNEAETTVTLDANFTQNSNYAAYEVKRTITAAAGNSKKVELVATWTDINGKTKSRIYVTHYTKGGLYDYIQ
ncbi:MAG TPA: hypothetical protein DCX06_12745 [Opitutae bacterium]|nr:hypothetical protein [Opitutae bacterium]